MNPLLTWGPQWQHLAKLCCNITTKVLVLIQSTHRTLPSMRGFFVLLFYSHAQFPLASLPYETKTAASIFSISIVLPFQKCYVSNIYDAACGFSEIQSTVMLEEMLLKSFSSNHKS